LYNNISTEGEFHMDKTYLFHPKKLSLSFFIFIFFFALFLYPEISNAAKENEPITSLKCNQFTFDATGSYDPDNEDIKFLWDFGDGNKSNESVVTHVYRKSGIFNVKLTIKDNSGLNCSTAVTSQRVQANIQPLADFTMEEMVCVNQPATFDASASYDDVNLKLGYEWDFGDGTNSYDEKRLDKSYTKGGSYKVSLTVDDKSGTVCNTHKTEKIIKVNEPPIADAGQEVIHKCITDESDMIVSFDASKSSDLNNDNLEYYWDFGDGYQERGKIISHKYRQIGNYDAKLVVKDNSNVGCETGVDFIAVRLNEAPQSEAGKDIIACPEEIIDFDGSKSYVSKKGTIQSKWFFGDGESSPLLKAMHSYDKPGKYQAILSIESKLNPMCPASRDTRNVTINSTPSVSINNPDSICLGNKIQFDASSANDADGDDLEFYWSFGDGTILRSGTKVEHEYQHGGEYKVTLIVDDGLSTSCSTDTANTLVKVNTPPMADAGPNLSCCVGLEAKFDASASSDPDGDRLTYAWDFGDGTKANGAVASHTYTKSGSYKVKVTVNDNSSSPCSKSTAGFVAEVNSMPVPVINIR